MRQWLTMAEEHSGLPVRYSRVSWALEWPSTVRSVSVFVS
jgi:hypothetical protein